MSNPTDTNTTPAKQGFGQELAQARKKCALSVGDVATELNILRRHVEAIEAEDYSALPEKAFARGFVINYAKLVGLDSDDLVARFLAAHPVKSTNETIKAPLQPMGTLHRGRAPIRVNFGLIAGIIAVLVFGVAILKMINGATQDNHTDDTPTEVQVVDSLSVSEQAQGAAIGGAGSALTASDTALDLATGGLDFWVKQPTEIRVVDATGNVLLSGKQNRGGYQVTGVLPLTVEIDNPTQVDLNFNQNPVKLAEHTTGNKATLTLQ